MFVCALCSGLVMNDPVSVWDIICVLICDAELGFLWSLEHRVNYYLQRSLSKQHQFGFILIMWKTSLSLI